MEVAGDWTSQLYPSEMTWLRKPPSFRRKNQVHLLDMISNGLVDESWFEKRSPELRRRMEELLNDPEG